MILQVETIAENVIDRRSRGEEISDEQLRSSYPELWSELSAALAVRQQALAARRAGRRNDVVEPLPISRIDEPIDIEDEAPAPADRRIAIEGYCVEREISRGGQAVVFLARQESTGRRVAIKVMSGGPYLTSLNRARFEREAQVLAQFDHPGIVSILDRGRTSDGSFFIVMDYVDGQDLDVFLEGCRRRGSDRTMVLGLFARVATAIDEAHQRGIVHRDIKPSNIKVDARGDAHILDFGLAHLADNPANGDCRLTLTGQIVGSLPWASPEQATGDVAHLGAPSDVYSLGIVLYHTMTGRFPYPVTGPIHEITRNICKAVAPSPASITDGPYGPIDAFLGGIILKAIEKDPARRYATAGQLSADLADYLAGRPIRVRPVSSWRRRAVLAVAGLLVCTGAACLPVLWPKAQTVIPAELPSATNGLGMRLIRIPEGRFRTGMAARKASPTEETRMKVLSVPAPFYISRTEVTRAQYRQVMGTLPVQIRPGDDHLPVDHVSWFDAVEFCRRLSATEGRTYRLPTEIEWEYACRAGAQTQVAGTTVLKDMGWYSGNSAGQLRAVAARQPNNWGLFDMHGNVAEWCLNEYETWLGDELVSRPVTPANGLPRSVRGGHVNSPEEACRNSARDKAPPAAQKNALGFRVVMEIPPATYSTTRP